MLIDVLKLDIGDIIVIFILFKYELYIQIIGIMRNLSATDDN